MKRVALQRGESLFGPVALDIVGLALRGEKEAAISKMNSECRPLLKVLRKSGRDYLQYMKASGEEKIKTADESYASNRMMLIIASTLAAIIALVLSLVISRDLKRSLGADPMELNAAAARAAAGDLRALVEESSAAAETLSHDSTRLSEMVRVFKLSQEVSSAE